MKQSIAAFALLVSLPLAAAEAPATDPSRSTAHFVTGGITKDEADYLRAQASAYPLELVFAKVTPAGSAFAADVQVIVRDANGNTVLSIPSAEPIVLARLAPGRYTIEATYEGRTRTAGVTIGGGHQKVGFTW